MEGGRQTITIDCIQENRLNDVNDRTLTSQIKLSDQPFKGFVQI